VEKTDGLLNASSDSYSATGCLSSSSEDSHESLCADHNGECGSLSDSHLPADRLNWPRLVELGLTRHERRVRSAGIGGSDANIILSGDRDKILALWHEKRGDTEAADLSDRLPVALGCWTEPFNRQWYERLTGHKVELVGVSISCSTYSWRRCTLDGFVEETGSTWEAKHTSAFAKPDEVLERYMPQLQHNMAVAKAERAILSVIFGNHRFEIYEIAADWLYQLDLLQAEEEFWGCVLDGTEPVPAPVPPPPKAIGTREVCLEGNNAWASAAVDWLDNRDAAKVHALACSSIKELVEDDVSRAFGHGIEAKRSKSGAISIRELAR
jgi:predicted phage-related endonuclease